MQDNQQVVHLRTQPDPEQERSLLEKCRKSAINYLVVLLQRMFDNADDALFELADKSVSNQEQTSFFDAMRELRRMRKGLEFGYKHHLNAHFNSFAQNPLSASNPTRSLDKPEFPSEPKELTLDLVDHIDLEESLAISNMVDKVKGRYTHHLNALEQRFQTLMHAEAIDIDQIPIGPTSICQSFAEPLKALDVELTVKLIIYKLFDKHCLGHLEALYQECNQLLIDAGIMPALRQQIIRQPGSRKTASRHRVADAVREGTQTRDVLSPTQQSLDSGAGYDPALGSTFTTLRALLQGPMGEGGAPGIPGMGSGMPGTGSAVPAESAEVIDFLTGVHSREQVVSQEEFRSELHSLRQAGKVSSLDNDIISIVDMLFDFILEDENLPVRAKALIARLQIPLIKTALVDRSFISDKRHPAKLLLNLMHRESLAIGDDADDPASPLMVRIDKVVTRICHEFVDDTKIFAEGLELLREFLQGNEAKERDIREAERKRLEQKEQQAMFDNWVSEVIANIIHNQALPKMVVDFVNGPWKTVMIRAYATSGDHGEEWRASLAFVDKLLWSVNQKANRGDRARLLTIIPEVIGTIREEMLLNEYPESDVEYWLDQLEGIHIKCLRGEPGKRVRVKAESILTSADGMSVEDSIDDECDEEMEEIVLASNNAYEDQRVAKVRDHAWQQVMDLQMGQWIELKGQNGKCQRAKLAWKSDFLGECTFINWKFKVVADLNFNELAQYFRDGQAKFMEQLPVFERAIDRLVNTLHQNRLKNA